MRLTGVDRVIIYTRRVAAPDPQNCMREMQHFAEALALRLTRSCHGPGPARLCSARRVFL